MPKIKFRENQSVAWGVIVIILVPEEIADEILPHYRMGGG